MANPALSPVGRRAIVAVASGLGLAIVARAVRRRARRLPLAGARVLITGGSRGLGLVLAREFTDEGARLAICARDAAELQRAQLDLETRGASSVTAIPCDLRDRRQVEHMVRMAAERLGGLDVLINNAGIIQVGPVETVTLEDYQDAMAVNFWAAVYTTHEALPLLRQQGGGRIVNISSIGGKVSVPHLLPYSASKFALAGWSEGLRAELAGDGILVTTVYPGLMRTGSPRNARFKGQHRAEYAWFSVSDALPGLAMTAERAARRILSACQHGDAQVVLSAPAKLATAFHALFPEVSADVLTALNFLLPGSGGIGTRSARGSDSESDLSPSWLTTLGDKAARRNNQIPGPQAEMTEHEHPAAPPSDR